MSGSNDDGGEEQSQGPFTRKSLLEGVTKTAGVLGAGTFVQKGFFAGVPYHGTPDLSGKVRHMTKRDETRIVCIVPLELLLGQAAASAGQARLYH